MPAPESFQAEQPPGRGSLRWPVIVIGLLAAHLLLMAIFAMIAMRDRSFAVVPNYYQNALNWDQTQAQRRAGEKLGWKMRIEPSERVDLLGNRSVSFALTDASGALLPAKSLELNYFHHAHAIQARQVTLPTTQPGQFIASLSMRYTGFWQFDAAADVGTERFSTSVTQFVGGANP
jgi:nitrogen fixation protein FixH